MEISEVRVKMIGNPTDRLKAFASVTFDGEFVIRDIKVIDGNDGVFVAMPSRKLSDRCPRCKCKNHLRAKYCNECGASLPKERASRDRMGRSKLHADIAHPINSECRHRLQERVVQAYQTEIEQAKLPGYEPIADEDGMDDHDFIENIFDDYGAQARDQDQDQTEDAASRFMDFDGEPDDDFNRRGMEKPVGKPRGESRPAPAAPPPPPPRARRQEREQPPRPEPRRAAEPRREPEPRRDVEPRRESEPRREAPVRREERPAPAPPPPPPVRARQEAPVHEQPADDFGAGID